MDDAIDSAAFDRMLAALNGANRVPPTIRTQGRPSEDPLRPGQFDSVLRQRRSVRDFTGMSAQAADVAALLTATEAADRLWGGEPCLVRVAALCWRVYGMDRAVYLRTDGRVRPITPVDERLAVTLAVQPELAAAPFWLVALGDMLAAERHYRGGAYRALLLSAGSALHYAWLAATARGLAGVMFAGLRAGQMRAVTGVGDSERRALVGLALGATANETAHMTFEPRRASVNIS
jgi:nitroreductase